MRRWIFGVMVFVAGALASGDFEAALEQAKRENRALVVMVSTQGCPYCRRFRDEVLPRPDIQKALREKIWLEVDKDKRMLPEVLSTRFVPSFFYFVRFQLFLGLIISKSSLKSSYTFEANFPSRKRHVSHDPPLHSLRYFKRRQKLAHGRG